jgi:hypothetical protein
MPVTILTSNLNVVDFKISNVLTPVLSSDFATVALTYIGLANPTNASVTLTVHDYSLDGSTWLPMTTSSPTTGLTFTPAGASIPFVWSIKTDIGTNIYNTSIKVRLRASATFGSDPVLTDYKIVTVYLAKAISTPTPVGQSPFSADYKGTKGSDLMKNAPKSDM